MTQILTGTYRGKAYALFIGRPTDQHYTLARERGYLVWNHRASMLEMCDGVRWRWV